MSNRWTDVEDALIREFYPLCKAREEILVRMPSRKWAQLVKRAKDIGVKRLHPVGRGLRDDNPCYKGRGKIYGFYVNRLRHGAIKRGLDHPLLDGSDESYGYLNDIITDLCPFSGRKLTFPTHSRDTSATASLDRINPSVGYVRGNVRWVHKTVNSMKMDMSDERFMMLMNDIARSLYV